jgi:hypothetical protein
LAAIVEIETFNKTNMETLQNFLNNPSNSMQKTFSSSGTSYYFVADPVTVVAVTEWLIDFISKTSDEARTERMEQALNDIRQSVQQINTKLDTVLEELLNLKIYIITEFRRSVELEVRGQIQTIIDNYPDFSERGRFRRVRDRMNNVLIDLQNSNRKLMGYGYAGIYSIFYGMIFELEMLNLLKAKNRTKRNCLQTYKSFFEAAISTNAGTPQRTRAEIQRDVDMIVQRRPQQNSQDIFKESRGYMDWRYVRARFGETYYIDDPKIADLYYSISGNLIDDNPFTVKTSIRNIRQGSAVPNEKFTFKELNQEFENWRIQTEREWNTDKANYKSMLIEIEILDTVLDLSNRGIVSIQEKISRL